MKNYLLLEAMKSVMIQMAINCSFPIDMTELDIHAISEAAKKELESNEQYKRVCKIEKLSEFVSFSDDKEVIAMLDILEAHEDETEITGWIEGIQMTQRYETSFTVKDLLAEIS